MTDKDFAESRIEVLEDHEGKKKQLAREQAAQGKIPQDVSFLPPLPEGHQPRQIVDSEFQGEKVKAIRHVVTKEDAKQQVDGSTLLSGEDGGPKIFSPRDDPRLQGILEGRSCLICTEFDQDMAAQAMAEQNFIERMHHDERWKSEWFDDYRIWGVCKAFSDSEGLRLNHGDAPATCAASDIDSDKPVGSEEGMEQIPCPYFKNRLQEGDTMHASAAGVSGPTKSGKGKDYIEKHQVERPVQEKAEGAKRRFEVAKSRLEVQQRAAREKKKK